MAEGFFPPHRLGVPGVSADQLCASMVRILPKTLLVLDIEADADEARTLGRNEAMPDGSETWYRYFTSEDREKVDDPDFAMGMVRHEFSRLVKVDIDRRTAIVESATTLTPEMTSEIGSNLATRHGAGLQLSFRVVPELIGGLRVRVGSNIYDGSVAGRLAALSEKF